MTRFMYFINCFILIRHPSNAKLFRERHKNGWVSGKEKWEWGGKGKIESRQTLCDSTWCRESQELIAREFPSNLGVQFPRDKTQLNFKMICKSPLLPFTSRESNRPPQPILYTWFPRDRYYHGDVKFLGHQGLYSSIYAKGPRLTKTFSFSVYFFQRKRSISKGIRWHPGDRNVEITGPSGMTMDWP